MEKITPVYTPDIGDAERHVPIGSRHSFYCGENVRILCSNCTRDEQERIATAGDQGPIPFEQR
eukprot:6477425-Amphidinium_carterae.1